MNKSIQHLHFLHENSRIIIESFNGQSVRTELLFCLSLFQRIAFASGSLLALLNADSIFEEIEYGAGIIIRSQLVDQLIVLDALGRLSPANLPDVTDESAAAFLAYCEEVLFDDANESAHRFIRDSIAVGALVGSQKDSLAQKFALGSRNMASAGKIHKRIGHGELSIHVQNVRDLYELYSKYDHFNAWSNKLLTVRNKAEKEKSLASGIDYMLATFAFLTSILFHFNQDERLVRLSHDWANYILTEKSINPLQRSL